MTTKTTKNILLLSIMAVTTISLMSSVAYADHDTQYYWIDEDVEYKCLSGINSIPKTSNVSPCSDYSTATNFWDNVSSSTWDLDPSSHGSRVNITGASLEDDDWAALAGITNNGDNTIEFGYIQFNTTMSETFGDVTAGDTNEVDFEYVAVHETGHLLRFTHSTTSGSVMEESIGVGDDFNGLHSHDISEIQGKY